MVNGHKYTYTYILLYICELRDHRLIQSSENLNELLNMSHNPTGNLPVQGLLKSMWVDNKNTRAVNIHSDEIWMEDFLMDYILWIINTLTTTLNRTSNSLSEASSHFRVELLLQVDSNKDQLVDFFCCWLNLFLEFAISFSQKLQYWGLCCIYFILAQVHMFSSLL